MFSHRTCIVSLSASLFDSSIKKWSKNPDDGRPFKSDTDQINSQKVADRPCRGLDDDD
jgi:hypothetical protein